MIKIVNTRVADDVYSELKHCCQFLNVSTLSALILPTINECGKLAKLMKNRELTKEQVPEVFRRSRALRILFEQDTPEEMRKLGDLFREITYELIRVSMGEKGSNNLLSRIYLQARTRFINVKVDEDIYGDLKRLCTICYPSVSDFLYCEIRSWCAAICIVEEKGFVENQSARKVPVAEMVKLSLSFPTCEGKRDFGERVWSWAYKLAEIGDEAFNLGNKKGWGYAGI
jgi:hypothetical protein